VGSKDLKCKKTERRLIRRTGSIVVAITLKAIEFREVEEVEAFLRLEFYYQIQIRIMERLGFPLKAENFQACFS